MVQPTNDRCPICDAPFGAHRQDKPGEYTLCDGQKVAPERREVHEGVGNAS